MSESAFGVEHTEVSKAFKLPSFGGARKAAGGTVSPINNFKAGAKAGLRGNGGAPFTGAARRGAQVGGAARRVGTNRAAQVGAAAGGGAYANQKATNNKRLPQYR
jgi:hypothetical protein